MNSSLRGSFVLRVVFALTCLASTATGQSGSTTHSLYVVNVSGSNISAYSIDGSTGALAGIAGSPFAAGFNASEAAITPDGAYLYITNASGNSVSAYSIAADGTLSAIAGSPFAAGSHPQMAAVSPDGAYLYVSTAHIYEAPPFNNGADKRTLPYGLFRLKIGP